MCSLWSVLGIFLFFLLILLNNNFEIFLLTIKIILLTIKIILTTVLFTTQIILLTIKIILLTIKIILTTVLFTTQILLLTIKIILLTIKIILTTVLFTITIRTNEGNTNLKMFLTTMRKSSTVNNVGKDRDVFCPQDAGTKEAGKCLQ